MIFISKKIYSYKCMASNINFLIAAIFIFVFSDTASSAVVWLVDPSVTVEHEYDDNFFLSSDSSNEDQVQTTTLTGELAFRGKSDRLDMETLLRLDKVNYNGDDDRLNDRDNQFLGISSKYAVNNRNTASLNARVNRDTLVRTNTVALSPEGFVNPDDIGIVDSDDVDINLVDVNVRRTRFSVNPRWSHSFSDRSMGTLGYEYNDVSYSDDSETGLTEFDRQLVRGGYRYRLSEKNLLTAGISAGFFRPDNNANNVNATDSDTYEARAGVVHQYSETLQLDFSLGGRYTEFDSTPTRGSSDSSGLVGNIGATKSTGLTTYRVNLERSVRPSSTGNEVETDRLTLDVRRAISETLNFNLRANAFETENIGSNSSNSGRDYLSLEPELSWQFLRSWNASLGYRYRYRDIDDDINGSGDSNSAFINFSYLPPRRF